MSKNMNINVNHITRVEGHGNIVVNATNGKIEKIQWQVPEAPRFFEAMVRGTKLRGYPDYRQQNLRYLLDYAFAGGDKGRRKRARALRSPNRRICFGF